MLHLRPERLDVGRHLPIRAQANDGRKGFLQRESELATARRGAVVRPGRDRRWRD
jgi:hypothetical protein